MKYMRNKTPICARRECDNLAHKHSWQREEIRKIEQSNLVDAVNGHPYGQLSEENI